MSQLSSIQLPAQLVTVFFFVHFTQGTALTMTSTCQDSLRLKGSHCPNVLNFETFEVTRGS